MTYQKIDLCRGATIKLDVDQANRRIYLWLVPRGAEVVATMSPDDAREVARHLVEFADRAEVR